MKKISSISNFERQNSDIFDQSFVISENDTYSIKIQLDIYFEEMVNNLKEFMVERRKFLSSSINQNEELLVNNRILKKEVIDMADMIEK